MIYCEIHTAHPTEAGPESAGAARGRVHLDVDGHLTVLPEVVLQLLHLVARVVVDDFFHPLHVSMQVLALAGNTVFLMEIVKMVPEVCKLCVI